MAEKSRREGQSKETGTLIEETLGVSPSMRWTSSVIHVIEVRLIARVSARCKILMLDDA